MGLATLKKQALEYEEMGRDFPTSLLLEWIAGEERYGGTFQGSPTAPPTKRQKAILAQIVAYEDRAGQGTYMSSYGVTEEASFLAKGLMVRNKTSLIITDLGRQVGRQHLEQQ